MTDGGQQSLAPGAGGMEGDGDLVETAASFAQAACQALIADGGAGLVEGRGQPLVESGKAFERRLDVFLHGAAYLAEAVIPLRRQLHQQRLEVDPRGRQVLRRGGFCSDDRAPWQ